MNDLNEDALKIKQAIEDRKIVYLRYEGSRRKVIPAVLGYTKAGTLTLRAYQVESQYKVGTLDWLECSLHAFGNILTFTETFAEDPPGYRRGGSGMTRIVAEL